MNETNVITPTKEDKEKIYQGTMDRLREAQANHGYHETSLKRIISIRDVLDRMDFKGNQVFDMADNLFWLKNLKENMKTAIEKSKNEVDSLKKRVDQLKKEVQPNGDQNKNQTTNK